LLGIIVQMKRYIDCILLINKEAGVTSHDEVNRVRKILNIKKVGHSGTLDPKVTGMLVMGIGKGTKVLEYMLMSEKVYQAEFVFHKKVSRPELEQALEKFTGSIKQTPPRKSSVKRVERERSVYEFGLQSFADDGRSAIVRCAVERGTYIRKLVHDIGDHLGVGAHMGQLHRTQVGPFSEHTHATVSTRDLQKKIELSRLLPFGIGSPKKYFHSLEEAMSDFPKIILDAGAVSPVRKGSPLFAPGVAQVVGDFDAGSLVLLFDDKEKLMGTALALFSSRELAKIEKGSVCRIQKII